MEPNLLAFFAAAAPAKDPELVTRSVQLFSITATLLSAFLLGVVIIGYLRYRRLRPRPAPRAGDSIELPDAWAEAGRRVDPGDDGRNAGADGERGDGRGGGRDGRRGEPS